MTVQELIARKKVIRSSRHTIGMELTDQGLLIRAPRFISNRDIDRFVNSNLNWIERQLVKWNRQQELIKTAGVLTAGEIEVLKAEAARVIPERVAYYAGIAGVTYNRVTVRCQKTRWGSCSAVGNLNFNCLLMLAPKEVLDSVVVHELCHRKEMNHSPRFYSEVLRIFPDYYKWNKWLKNNGKYLMARAGFGK